MSAIKPRTVPASQARPRGRRPAGVAEATGEQERTIFALPLGAGILGMAIAFLTLVRNDTDGLIPLLLGLQGALIGAAVAVRRARTDAIDRAGLVLAVASAVAALLVVVLPVWMFGSNVNGIVHRTVVSGPLLLVLGTAITAQSIRRFQAASPSGQDLALVPVLTVAILVGVVGYLAVLGRVVLSGLGSFRFDLLTTAWHPIAAASGFDYARGYLNNILGTFLLIALTLLIAVLPGVGAGVFMSQYPGRIARVMGFCTTMLRAIAMFILGVTALGLIRFSTDARIDTSTFLSQAIRGGYSDEGHILAEQGSFLLAAIFLALLVMPVIARLTEEGLRSVPREIHEGSVALGATDGYSLRRILLPWAAPNILTALILAGAEAAGGLAVIVFLAVPGVNGIGLFNGVTTLDYAVFASTYGPRQYADSMRDYRFTAGLLLLILTIGLTLIAMVLQRRFAKRYRGSITA